MRHPLRPSMMIGPRATRPRNTPSAAIACRTRDGAEVVAVPGVRDDASARLEAVLWLADEPVTARKLALAAGLPDAATARRLVARLQEWFEAEGSAFRVDEMAGGYQLFTRPEYYPWLVRLRANTGSVKLPATLLETLAIIAYRQPVMRADIEAVRGVHCGDALRQLMERKLVQITGRHDSLGRPVLYGTTKMFLQMFGLRSLEELPGA